MYTLFGFSGSGSAAAECALEMTGASYRIVQAALRLADVGQNDGTAEDIGEESCSLEVGLGGGVGVVGYVEVTLCPRGETEEG